MDIPALVERRWIFALTRHGNVAAKELKRDGEEKACHG